MRTAILLLALAILTSGCHERSLTRQQLSTLGKVEVMVCTNQNNLQVDPGTPPEPERSPIPATGRVDTSTTATLNRASAGLRNIGNSISHENRRRALESRAAPMVRELATYDFGADLLLAMQIELAKVSSLSVEVRPTVVTTGCSGPMRPILFDQSTASAVLFFAVSYFLRNRGGDHILGFSSQASIFSRTNVLWDARRMPDPSDPVADGNAVYNRLFDYNFTADGRTNLRAVFRQAAHSLAAQLAADLNKP